MSHFDMELAKRYAQRYIQASRKQKSRILDDYVHLSRCKRNTAVYRLKTAYRKQFKPRVLVGSQKEKKRGRKKTYNQIHYNLIQQAWDLADHICAERMYPELRRYIKALDKAGRLKSYSQEVVSKSKEMSLGTLKNIIATFPRSKTNKHKGNVEIYKQIPIEAHFRKYTREPGNIEVDYVEHNGGNSSGQYGLTGTYVDIYSQWITRGAALGKHLKSVAEIYDQNIQRIGTGVKRLHPDNCKSTLQMLTRRLMEDKQLDGVKISRSRPYKKNDNAHVEQKNGDKVRKLVGYHRYDTQRQIKLLNELYEVEDTITNFFTPSMKLRYNEMDKYGRVLRRVHSGARTPYQRLLRSRQVNPMEKERLKLKMKRLNLVELREKSTQIKDKLGSLRK